jgi:hypothetical protein
MYKLVNSKDTNQLASITKNDGSGLILSIPVNPENSDYIAYLAWLELGNTPTPADEGTQ